MLHDGGREAHKRTTKTTNEPPIISNARRHFRVYYLYGNDQRVLTSCGWCMRLPRCNSCCWCMRSPRCNSRSRSKCISPFLPPSLNFTYSIAVFSFSIAFVRCHPYIQRQNEHHHHHANTDQNHHRHPCRRKVIPRQLHLDPVIPHNCKEQRYER